MADVSYVNLAPVIAAVHSAEANIMARVSAETAVIKGQLNNALSEIERLKRELAQMEKNARMRAALQKAVTEVIRVRQELDDKFGAHKEIRNNMVGIIQATDSGLITKETIARVSEELMLSAPKYWLAPCLIAISAWIADNKDLANRAIKEAVRRDNEKTSLLMSLIMRRVNARRAIAGRPTSNSTFVWLSRYFSLQNALNMNASIVSYVDAYTNGIFGADTENLCADSVNEWLHQLAEHNPNFKNDQIKYWQAIFSTFVPTYKTEEYLALKYLSPQYDLIYHFVTKIDAINKEGGLTTYISNISHAEINTQELINSIDENLMTLVKNYDTDEEPLRDEEQYLEFVKEYKGDEEIAKGLMDNIRAKRNTPNVDFASRLSLAITDKRQSASVRKTAVKLLYPYISEAFGQFINLGDKTYPDNIDLKFIEPGLDRQCGFDLAWNVTDGSNKEEILAEIDKHYKESQETLLSKIDDTEGKKKKKIGTILAAGFFWVFFIPLFIGLAIRSKGVKMLQANAQRRKRIRDYFGSRCKFHKEQVSMAIDLKLKADTRVNHYLENGIDMESVF